MGHELATSRPPVVCALEPIVAAEVAAAAVVTAAAVISTATVATAMVVVVHLRRNASGTQG